MLQCLSRSWMSCLPSWRESICLIMIHTAKILLALMTLRTWWYNPSRKKWFLSYMSIGLFTVLQSTLQTGTENIKGWLRYWAGYSWLFRLELIIPKLLPSRFYPSKSDPGFYWYRVWLLAEARSLGSWLLEASTRGSTEESNTSSKFLNGGSSQGPQNTVSSVQNLIRMV